MDYLAAVFLTIFGGLLVRDIAKRCPIWTDRIIRVAAYGIMLPDLRRRRTRNGETEAKLLYDSFRSSIASSQGAELSQLSTAFGSLFACIILNTYYLKDKYLHRYGHHSLRTIVFALFLLTGAAIVTYFAASSLASPQDQLIPPIYEERPPKPIPPTDFQFPDEGYRFASPTDPYDFGEYSDGHLTVVLVDRTDPIPIELSQSFRSLAPSIEWLGHVVDDLVFTSEGDRLVSYRGAERDDAIGAWSPDGEEVFTIRPSAGSATTFTSALNLDGGARAPVLTNGAIELWDGAIGVTITIPSLGDGLVETLAVSHDGAVLASYRNLGLRERALVLWTASGLEFELLPHVTGSVLQQAVFATTSNTLAVTFDDGSGYLWDRSNRVQTALPQLDGAVIDDLALSPDGVVLASYRGTKPETTPITIWASDTDTFTVLAFSTPAVGQPSAFSPDGSTLAVATIDGGVQLWHHDRGLVAPISSTDGSTVESIAWSPDGARLITYFADGRANIWLTEDLSKPAFAWSPIDTNGLVRDVAVGLTQDALVIAHADGSVQLVPFSDAASSDSAHGADARTVSPSLILNDHYENGTIDVRRSRNERGIVDIPIFEYLNRSIKFHLYGPLDLLYLVLMTLTLFLITMHAARQPGSAIAKNDRTVVHRLFDGPRWT